MVAGSTAVSVTIGGSRLYGEDDPSSQKDVNLDQSRNSVELPHPSNHPQKTHHQFMLIVNTVSFRKELQDWALLLAYNRFHHRHEAASLQKENNRLLTPLN